MSENQILRIIQNLREAEKKLEARVKKLEKEAMKEEPWTPLKFLARKVTCTRQNLYKKIVASGKFEPGIDFIKDGKDICVSSAMCRLFEERYSDAA